MQRIVRVRIWIARKGYFRLGWLGELLQSSSAARAENVRHSPRPKFLCTCRHRRTARHTIPCHWRIDDAAVAVALLHRSDGDGSVRFRCTSCAYTYIYGIPNSSRVFRAILYTIIIIIDLYNIRIGVLHTH